MKMSYEDILSVLETYGTVRVDQRSVEAKLNAQAAGDEHRPIIIRLHNQHDLGVYVALGSCRSVATVHLYETLVDQFRHTVCLIERGE